MSEQARCGTSVEKCCVAIILTETRQKSSSAASIPSPFLEGPSSSPPPNGHVIWPAPTSEMWRAEGGRTGMAQVPSIIKRPASLGSQPPALFAAAFKTGNPHPRWTHERGPVTSTGLGVSSVRAFGPPVSSDRTRCITVVG
jgi:hypothetical protein